MKSFLSITLALALCAGRAHCGFFPKNAFSDDARGLAGAQFLKVPPSARFSSLAGSGLSLGGADSFFLNPAGTSGAGRSAAVSYESLLEGSSRTGLVFSRPSAAGVFSAGLLYSNFSPGLEKLDGSGGGSGDGITAYDAALGAGWSRRSGWLDFGFALKYIRSRLAEASGSSVALDAGLVFREAPPSRTELALAVRNFGPPIKLGSESASLPFELGGGIKWKYTPDFNILIEGRLPCDHSPYLAFAGEWFLPYSARSGLFLRSGLNFKNYDDHGFMGAFAGGFGLKFGGVSLDYAFAPYGELGSAHRMTAGLAWGGAGEKPEARPEKALPEKALLAVAPFYGEAGVTETEAAVVRNLLEAELDKTGRFRLVEREGLDFILAEKKLSYSGLSEERNAAELGRVFGAELAVFGSVSRNKNGYLITARLVDASSAAILRSEAAVAADDYLFRDAARQLAAALSR
ncbi:MAG: CsgG/HfaB family protein [Elusimicrobiota bacterium]|nr:CsgG/HfaB family protein [Elusimicrobiota bacterium]